MICFNGRIKKIGDYKIWEIRVNISLKESVNKISTN
jgi:hypothetical protein